MIKYHASFPKYREVPVIASCSTLPDSFYHLLMGNRELIPWVKKGSHNGSLGMCMDHCACP